MAWIDPTTGPQADIDAEHVRRAFESLGRRLRRVGGRWTRAGATQTIATSTATAVSWTTEEQDTDLFLTPTSTTITVPQNLGGIYVAQWGGVFTEDPTNVWWNVVSGGVDIWQRLDNTGTTFVWGSWGPQLLQEGDTFVQKVYHEAGANRSWDDAFLEFWRVSP